jgi:hypothetical protein
LEDTLAENAGVLGIDRFVNFPRAAVMGLELPHSGRLAGNEMRMADVDG